MLQHFRRNIFIQAVIGSNCGRNNNSRCGHGLRVGTECVKKLGSSSTPGPRLTAVVLPQLLHLQNRYDQSPCKSPEQMALCKVESLAFDDISVFIVRFDVATEKGREQQVRKQAKCFLRTPRWQYVLCQWCQENIYFLLHRKIIHPSNFCSMMFNWSPFCLQCKKITFVTGYN